MSGRKGLDEGAGRREKGGKGREARRGGGQARLIRAGSFWRAPNQANRILRVCAVTKAGTTRVCETKTITPASPGGRGHRSTSPQDQQLQNQQLRARPP